MVSLTPALRLVVFVPKEALESFVEAVQGEIPSFLGPYDRVMWWSHEGVEQFRPLEGAQSAHGTPMETKRLPSVKVEISLPNDKEAALSFIRTVIIPAHPWEKPVIHLYNIEAVK